MWKIAGLALLLAVWCSGCALCTNCGDDDYSAYGGRWQRDISNHGRVGSVFEPAGSLVEEYETVPAGEPTPADSE